MTVPSNSAQCRSQPTPAPPNEDFILFRDEFREAAKDKTDQARILRGALRGRAVLLISNLPHGTTPVNDLWSILERQFGNSNFAHINYHLNTLKATQTLSDATVEIDPDKAARWFLDFGNTIQSILRIGDRTTSLGMECFNGMTLSRVSKCLPYTLRQKVYYLKEHGRERLANIIDMVTTERDNIERRARDENNLRL